MWLVRPRARYTRAVQLKARVVEALPGLLEGRVVLLSPQCLICGRPLTNAVARARLIGPECAGRASIAVPLHTVPVEDEDELFDDDDLI